MKFRFRTFFITIFLLSCVTLNAYAKSAHHGLPFGATVVSGSATISRPNHHTEIITTSTNQAILNFKGFSINSGNLVDVIEPNAGSSLLIRVTGINPSNIYGTLDVSSGSLFLVNPNGIIFGPNSTVNAPALLVSTLDITDNDFLNGNYNFFKEEHKGNSYIINQGRLAASPGGYIALLSQAVNNQGVIIADQGTVALGAGNKMTVALDSQDEISVVVNDAVENEVLGPDGQPINNAIGNSGTIQANGGKVLLTADVLNDVFDNAVNNSGIVQAGSLQNKNGDVEIVASGAPVTNLGSVEGDQISINSQDDINSTGSLLSDGIVTLDSEGDIYSLGVLDASEGVIVSGNSFKVGGSFEVGGSELMNTNNAIEFVANTSVSGYITDESFNGGNIIIDPGVTITLTGDTNFISEKAFLMTPYTSSIDGGGYNLSITAGSDSTLSNLNNINNFTLDSILGSNVTFTEVTTLNNTGSLTVTNATFALYAIGDLYNGLVTFNLGGGLVEYNTGSISNNSGSIITVSGGGNDNTGLLDTSSGTITISNYLPTLSGLNSGTYATGTVSTVGSAITVTGSVSLAPTSNAVTSHTIFTNLLNSQISSTIAQSSNSNSGNKFGNIFNPSVRPVADIDLSAFNSSAK